MHDLALDLASDLACDTEGATAIEYALIAVFIGIALIVSMQSLGNALSNNFSMVANAENNATATAAA
jgi:Flp pilus assembly pilin Flp